MVRKDWKADRRETEKNQPETNSCEKAYFAILTSPAATTFVPRRWGFEEPQWRGQLWVINPVASTVSRLLKTIDTKASLGTRRTQLVFRRHDHMRRHWVANGVEVGEFGLILKSLRQQRFMSTRLRPCILAKLAVLTIRNVSLFFVVIELGHVVLSPLASSLNGMYSRVVRPTPFHEFLLDI